MFKIGDKVYIKQENQGETIDYFFFITKISEDNVTLMAVVDEKLTLQEHYEVSFEFVEQLKNIELAENYPAAIKIGTPIVNLITGQTSKIIKHHFKRADLCYVDYGDNWEIAPFGILHQ